MPDDPAQPPKEQPKPAPAASAPRAGDDRRAGLDRRAGEIKTRVLLDGQYVFREGETGDLAFVVKSGKIEILKTADGKEMSLGVVSEGGMFGEMALIDNKPRMAGARAKGGPAEIMVISRQHFETQLKATNPFIRKLLLILAANVRNASTKIK
jgi:CRP-like cAMP-binding protein